MLAGGVGSRFWPVSTRTRPKQLLPLAGDRPLIAETLDRARSLADDAHIRILAGEHLVEAFRLAVPDLPGSSYLVEPRARGTCPVLAWAASEIARVDPEAVLVSLHADHLVHPLPAFQDTVRVAAELATTHERLVTIGVAPDRIETGFGHIQLGAPIEAGGEPRRSTSPRSTRSRTRTPRVATWTPATCGTRGSSSGRPPPSSTRYAATPRRSPDTSRPSRATGPRRSSATSPIASWTRRSWSAATAWRA